ncbi:MAG: hypothetical protein KDK53_00470 [Maritimibacter sp.]|nr:hypothetical protein [Maritimibacter sp.]
MFYLDEMHDGVNGWHCLSTSSDWEGWLKATIPHDWDREVKRRLVSNLKHTLVGLEMKAGLIQPQQNSRKTGRSLLFEPYFQVMTFEFCVGTFSVCEGLGSAFHLANAGGDAERRVGVDQWKAALVAHFDPTHEHGLEQNVTQVKVIRDKMHQDRLGAREDIDWHDFGYGS